MSTTWVFLVGLAAVVLGASALLLGLVAIVRPLPFIGTRTRFQAIGLLLGGLIVGMAGRLLL